MKDISHPNILSLVDFHKDKKYIYLLTNFCNNGNLEEYVENYKKKFQRPLPEEQAM